MKKAVALQNNNSYNKKMKKKKKNMFFFGKKAGIEISTETVIKTVLVVVILLALWGLTGKLFKIFSPETEEATFRNFDQLVATVKNMNDGDSFASYPLYLDDDYSIVGYLSGESAIRGTCTTYSTNAEEKSVKPELCGAGEEGCLCLCESTDDFTKLCQENEDVKKCIGKGTDTEDFDVDISFTGGTFTDGSGQCSFAIVKGTGAVQNIYLKRTDKSVRICSKECS